MSDESKTFMFEPPTDKPAANPSGVWPAVVSPADVVSISNPFRVLGRHAERAGRGFFPRSERAILGDFCPPIKNSCGRRELNAVFGRVRANFSRADWEPKNGVLRMGCDGVAIFIKFRAAAAGRGTRLQLKNRMARGVYRIGRKRGTRLSG